MRTQPRFRFLMGKRAPLVCQHLERTPLKQHAAARSQIRTSSANGSSRTFRQRVDALLAINRVTNYDPLRDHPAKMLRSAARSAKAGAALAPRLLAALGS